MSFAADLKTELCGIEPQNEAEVHAFAYGLVLFARRFSAEDISFTIAHEPTAALFKSTIEAHTGAAVTVSVVERMKPLYNISVDGKEDRLRVLDKFYHSPADTRLRINRSNLEDEESVPCFLRGAFLTCGALSDPAKDYHIEFDVGVMNLSKDLLLLISETLAQPKITVRRGSHIVYYKESEHIEDLLTYMGAMHSTVELMNVKILKDVRNRVNRRTNCETANIDKTVAASAAQVEDIEYIISQRGKDYLQEELRALAELRLENPELSLRELGELLEPELSRSGVNHRMRRIQEAAAEIREIKG